MTVTLQGEAVRKTRNRLREEVIKMGAHQLAELDKLDQLWGEDYDLAVTSAGWIAKRLDNGRALVAANPGKLHTLIAADHGLLHVSGDCDESAGIA